MTALQPIDADSSTAIILLGTGNSFSGTRRVLNLGFRNWPPAKKPNRPGFENDSGGLALRLLLQTVFQFFQIANKPYG